MTTHPPSEITILEVNENDFADWQQLALARWPDHEPDEMQAILLEIYQSPSQTAFLVQDDQSCAVGFINLSFFSTFR